MFPKMDTYQWFLYLGIFFFIIHLSIYGFGLNLSYFGLILIYIGCFRPILSPLIKNIIWIFIILDILANFQQVYEYFFRPSSVLTNIDKKINEDEEIITSK